MLRALKVHFIGIGGTGMGALAQLLKRAGHDVRGSDGPLYPPMSTQLAAAEIPVMEGFGDPNLAWDPDCVVVGNVCSRDHVEVVAAQKRGLRLESFPSLLAQTLLQERRPIVVAGTHGKTTTSSLVTWVLRHGGRDPSFLIGGVPRNTGRGASLGEGDAIVLEGDEYDTAFFDKKSKFLHYRPKRAILTGVEFDHADIFDDLDQVRAAFRAFVETIDADGDLVVHRDDAEAMGVAASAQCNVLTYRVLPPEDDDANSADYCLRVLKGTGRRTRFEVFESGASLGIFTTSMVGRFNLANALAAIAIGRREGLEPTALQDSIRRFRGVKRRQELVGVAQGVRVVEDFAHHPTAVDLTVTAVRRRYPDKALHVCFEPRSATSRRRVFLEPYAASFDAASQVYLGPLFRPDKIPPADRLDPQVLAQSIAGRQIPAEAYDDTDALCEAVVSRAAPGDTVLVLSCGSFDGLPRKLLFGFGDPVMFAEPGDDAVVDALLDSYGIATPVRSDDLDTLVIRDENGVVGSVSLEVHGDSAFFFGLAVDKERRGEGLGWVLGDCMLRHAQTVGARVVYLITNTAADFFGTKLGFRPIDVEEVAGAIRSSDNFAASSGGDDSVCMVLELGDQPSA